MELEEEQQIVRDLPIPEAALCFAPFAYEWTDDPEEITKIIASFSDQGRENWERLLGYKHKTKLGKGMDRNQTIVMLGEMHPDDREHYNLLIQLANCPTSYRNITVAVRFVFPDPPCLLKLALDECGKRIRTRLWFENQPLAVDVNAIAFERN